MYYLVVLKEYFQIQVQDQILKHINFKPDILLTIWSELATHACSRLECKKFNYSGNNQYNVYAANYELSLLENNLKSKKETFIKNFVF